MIFCIWINGSPDPHYGGKRRPADWAELKVLDTTGSHEVTVATDCLPDHPSQNVHVCRVPPLGGNPYHDRWRHFAAWLTDRDDEWIWATDANDVALLNDPYPDWLDGDMLYVGSEPVGGENARSVGFWWMRALHTDHADWIATHADLPLLNAGLLGGTPATLREFTRDLVGALEDCPNDVTDMAAVNRVLHDDWSARYVTGHPIHTPMWSFLAADDSSIWAHK